LRGERTMTRCETYQAQLLEHLYGLLDADQSLALIEHAGQCDDCRAALQKADLHKQLLATACKSEFAGVRFEVPPPEVVAVDQRERSASRSGQFAWRRWALAAAILLAVTTIGIPTGRYISGFAGAQKELRVASVDLDRLLKEHRKQRENQEKAEADAAKNYKGTELAVAALEKE